MENRKESSKVISTLEFAIEGGERARHVLGPAR